MVEGVTVRIPQGFLRGQRVKTQTGTPYYSFQAIPYAKPPVGPLRFKAPEPAEPWDGVRDALKEGPVAPQSNFFGRHEYSGEEDCLYLNIFTPELPDARDNPMKPVMVYIHGGGYFLGSGNKDMHGPGRMMNTGEVVLVTMNYRLGALGFLSTGDSVVPGNNGMKDQVLALRWVQQNIAQFGGDPRNVTVAGSSAGGASAHLLCMSPMAEGLFHRAIASSGCALCSWTADDPAHARKKAFRLGKTLGCHTNNSRELLQFLLQIPARKLVEYTDKTLMEEERHPLPVFFRPVVETGKQKEEAFLLGRPLDIMKAGKFIKVPLIIGVCSKEGLLIAKDYITNKSWYYSLTNNFPSLISLHMKTERGTNYTHDIVSRAKKFYFGDNPVTKETLSNAVELYGDILFNVWTYRSVLQMMNKTTSPIYFYLFSFDGHFGERLPLDIGVSGAGHCSDLKFLFETMFNKTHYLDPEDINMKMCSRMLKMWLNFAKTGNPTPEEDPELGVIWKPVTKNAPNYLNIDKELSLETDFMKENMKLWNNVKTSKL